MRSIAIALTFWFATAPLLLPCSCGPQPPPLKALEAADAVFLGTVESIQERDIEVSINSSPSRFTRLFVTFTPEIVFKGDRKGPITVSTGVGGGDCGFEFIVGKSYLVYSYVELGGFLYTSICSRTQESSRNSREILELQGRLPKPKKKEEPPTLSLRGRINDSGYNGYVFDFTNNLHERVFYIGMPGSAYLTQLLIDDKWVDCVPNYGIAPSKESDITIVSSENVAAWMKDYKEVPCEQAYSYIDNGATVPVFASPPSVKHPWRIGFQYVTESGFYSGDKIQESNRIVWSPPIIPDVKTRDLTFTDAFSQKAE